jgi:hypothetical protein
MGKFRKFSEVNKTINRCRRTAVFTGLLSPEGTDDKMEKSEKKYFLRHTIPPTGNDLDRITLTYSIEDHRSSPDSESEVFGKPQQGELE